MVSVPGEVYAYGTIWMFNSVFTPIGIVIASKFYLPVFQQMKIISLFKASHRQHIFIFVFFLLAIAKH